MVALVLFQPDIPQNTGAILRLGACLGVAVHVIEPTGFDLSDRGLKRAGMDYVAKATLIRHTSFSDFTLWRNTQAGRLLLMTTGATKPYTGVEYRADDLILLGRESAGVPESVHGMADERLLVPMQTGLRSINVALIAAMAPMMSLNSE